MNVSTSPSISRPLVLSGVALLLLAGCATRPPRTVGPPQTPVMPPPARETESRLPPPVEVNFEPVDVAPLPSRPAPVSAAASRPAPAPRPGTAYTLKKGESLSAVAARNKMSWVKLAEYNRIADPNKVREGQVILIPEAPGRAPASNRPAPPPPAANRGNTYVVQSGDNLSTVARTYNTTVADLKTENNLRSDRLLVGQILKLPQGSSRPSAPAPRPASAVETSRPMTPVQATRTVEPSEPEEITPPEPAPTVEAPAAAEDPLVDKPFTIVVMEGDTLESIAANYVVSVEKIRELNNLPANATLKAGQKLEMPPGLY